MKINRFADSGKTNPIYPYRRGIKPNFKPFAGGCHAEKIIVFNRL